MVEIQGDLPLRFTRAFQPWEYQVSHRKLVLRSRPLAGSEEMIDVIFLDVLGMKVRLDYHELRIADAGSVEEIDDFVDVPERHSSRYMNLTVSDGSHEGFVVCGSLVVDQGEPGRVTKIMPPDHR